MFKASFDVAVRDDFAVRAAVIRDHMGKLVGACVHKFQVDNPLE